MKLYSYYRSSSSYRVRIALEYKKIPYDYISVHLLNNGGEQNSPRYNKINSKNEVPVLVDKNLTLSQSTAIFLYLDRIHLENPLFPKELPLFEKCFELVEIINSGIQPLQNLAVLQKLKKDFSIDEEQKLQWVRDSITTGLKAYCQKLNPNDFFSIGNEVSASDMFLVPQLYNAHRFNLDFSGLEKLLEIEERCLSLDFFKRAHPDAQPDAPD